MVVLTPVLLEWALDIVVTLQHSQVLASTSTVSQAMLALIGSTLLTQLARMVADDRPRSHLEPPAHRSAARHLLPVEQPNTDR